MPKLKKVFMPSYVARHVNWDYSDGASGSSD